MNEKIQLGVESDYEAIIDFGNYVFGLDFPSFLPKLYKNHSETANCHYLVKEQNFIKAMVGSFPLSLSVNDVDLKVKGIGTVSVHRYRRSLGYMKLLMNQAVSDMIEEGCDLAVLTGLRQRYEHWGFTPCGVIIHLNFLSTNIKHYPKSLENSYVFKEYNDMLAEDLELAKQLHDAQPVHANRTIENFIETASSCNHHIYFIYESNVFRGYLCASNHNKNISEIYLQHPETIDVIILSFMKDFQLSDATVKLQYHRRTEFLQLSKHCETYSIHPSANLFVINYVPVMKAFLELKKTFSPLAEGTLTLNIQEKGTYTIEVKEGCISVKETSNPYDLSLTHLEASALLFSHASFINSYQNPLILSWFPLPLFYPELDNV